MKGNLDGTVFGLRPWTFKTEKELSTSVLDVHVGLVPESYVQAGTTLADTVLPEDVASAFVASAFEVESSK